MQIKNMGAHSYFYLLLFFCGTLLWACQDKHTTEQSQTANTSEAVHQEPASPNKQKLEGITEDYVNTNRVIWQKPEVVINLLGDLSGKTVADIGAGTGFFALRLAPKAEKVIAIDIDSRFVNHIDSLKMLELPEESQSKLETRLALPDDPKIAEGEADVILIVNTFIYIKDKPTYLQSLRNAIAEGGQLLIIDFKKKRTPLGPPSSLRMPLYEVENLLIEAGYKDVSANDTVLDYQYVVTARR
jgi:ubiquinone/menaquinone biosynthesis C-methylase UbiE